MDGPLVRPRLSFVIFLLCSYFFMTKEDMPHANDHLYLVAAKFCASVFSFLGRSNTLCLEFLKGGDIISKVH